MKKILLLITILISLSLTSCSGDGLFCEISPELCNTTYTPITADNEGLVTYDKKLTVNNLTEDIDFTVSELNTFKYQNNQDIVYVDAQEFLYVLHDGLTNYRVNTDNNFEVSYRFRYSLFASYKYYIDINLDNNTIYFNDFSFGDNFNSGYDSNYSTNLKTVGQNHVEGTPEKTIDLTEYNMQIVKEDNTYFMPLYLANLLFSGNYLNVYQNKDNLYIIDDFSLAKDIFVDDNYDKDVDIQNIIDNTVNYAALFFDNYYGLKEYFNIDSYKDVFINMGLYDINNFDLFDKIFLQFIYNLDDLHTMIQSFGFNEGDVSNVKPDPDSKLLKFYRVYSSEVCQVRDYEVKLTEYDEYYILEINEFSLDTKELLAEELVDLDTSKPVYIDLGCNSGGNLVAVFELIMYLTDGPIDFQYSIENSGEIYTETYKMEPSIKLNNQFYLFTSNMTFSAANLFTSMVKDNNLATIIGSETSGGACSILYTIFPNNMIITYSSHMIMINQDGEIIEAGITPDQYINIDISLEKTLNTIYNVFGNYGQYTVVDNSTKDSLNIDVTLNQISPDIEFINTTLNIYDSDDLLIETKEFSGTAYHYSYSTSNLNSYRYEIVAEYINFGIDVHEVIAIG